MCILVGLATGVEKYTQVWSSRSPEYVLQRISQGEMREEKQRDVQCLLLLMKLNFIFR